MNRNSVAISLSGLALLGALLGVSVGPAASQQAADDFSDAVSATTIYSNTDPNGVRVTLVTIDGALGEVSFELDPKQAAAVMGDPKDGTLMDMALLSRHYVQHAQVSFGATDEEWMALTPKIMRVRRLNLQLSSHGRSGRTQAEGVSELAKAWGALAKVLANKEAQAAQIKPLLDAVNGAEAKVRAELRQAEKELKDLLTVRQEAMLVRMGIFEVACARRRSGQRKGQDMFHRRLLPLASGMVFVGFVCAGSSLAQAPGMAASAPAGASSPDPNAARVGAGMVAIDPNQLRKSYSDRMRENLGASEEEWKTLEPLVDSVRDVRHALVGVRGRGMGFVMGGWFNQGGEPTKEMTELADELARTSSELAKVIQDKDAGPDRIKLALQDYRQARAKARAGLEKAQKELKDLVTVRQEATLKQLGILD